ncbi:MAG TPA: LytR C-terminal domain-containing protein [Actinomycetota bacterium]
MRPGPTARAAAVFAVFLAVFIAVDQLSRAQPHRAAKATASVSSAPAATSTTLGGLLGAPPTSAPAPAATTTSMVPPSSEPATTASVSTTTLPRVAGVTVQVLNGVFVPGLAHQVADKLRAAGYDVVATQTAFGHFTVSRIYYTEGHQADALALQARFPAFKVIAPAPSSLSRDIALHVVIGGNYKDI